MTRYRKLVGGVVGIVIAAAVIIIVFMGYQYFDGVGYAQDEKFFDKASVYMEVMGSGTNLDYYDQIFKDDELGIIAVLGVWEDETMWCVYFTKGDYFKNRYYVTGAVGHNPSTGVAASSQRINGNTVVFVRSCDIDSKYSKIYIDELNYEEELTGKYYLDVFKIDSESAGSYDIKLDDVLFPG
jgi:hypothetical protein